jgi:hypothetical protein
MFLPAALALANGSALRFDGGNSYLSVPHSPAFNSYPFSVTAWFRTSNASNIVQGIASKYLDASANGWALFVQNGRLRAFHYRNGNFFNWSIDATSAAVVADGFWHHAALTVDSSGGKLYLDGVLVGSGSWSGAAGGTTSTEPLSIGRYSPASGYAAFDGDLDEVTYWNRGLGPHEVNYLKHRPLAGTEDNLIGLWNLDDGGGPVAVDATGHGYNALLMNSPVWRPSTAPLVFNLAAQTAISLNGTTQNVSVAHKADLNAYPLTMSAWVKTRRVATTYDAIINKYQPGAGDGYSLHMYNGRVYAYYFAEGTAGYVYSSDPGIDGGFIADGQWHHVAFTVGPGGGKILVDGVLRGSLGWTGTAGAPATTTSILIGQYPLFGAFAGEIDEVALWKRELSPAEVASMRNQRLVGNESNLVAYWRFDEGAGSSLSDLTGLGHDGTIQNGATWVGSTALLGDGSSVVHTSVGAIGWGRRFAFKTAPAHSAFAVNAPVWVRRLDDFGAPGGNTNVSVELSWALQGTIAGAVPLTGSSTQLSFSMPPFNAAALQTNAGGTLQAHSLNAQPSAGTQLDSVNDSFQFALAGTWSVNGGMATGMEAALLAAVRLLHFNGHVFFGNVDTIVTNVGNSPVPGTSFAPSHVQSPLSISPNGAYLAQGPGVRFGGGAPFNVNLGVNGTATNVNGSFTLSAPDQFFEAAGIRYQLPGAALNASGLTATNLLAWFPAGFGVQTSTNNRALRPYASAGSVVLGPDLLPTTSPMVFTAASYGVSRLWFAEETKPFLIGATQIEWRIPQGEFFIPQADSLLFVREEDDRVLSSQAPALVNPLAADRISNDTYYRHVAAVPGTPVYIRRDANGAALLTMQASLRENEYRPHFPYLARNVGGHIPVVGGEISIAGDLVDTSASYLLLAGPAPLVYARDCPPEGGCSGAATVGAQVLQFTSPAGHLGLGELRFTPDGGLLANGQIPPANLTWGFIGGGNYAQRTSDVQAGAYHVPGTFLRGDQSANAAPQRPAALLLTGWGNASNPAYVERPGTSAYADGLANYAGLNFRAPAQGRSFIAGQDSGLYPLTARSKYYTRLGGVSGIHESATFPANMSLYGYAFTFTSYRLSYLDSANWESRTDGQIALPTPAGFNVEFERMKFLCRGNLDSAKLPSNIGAKHMVYWNTDLKPMSLQFKPRAGDPCSLTERYLVLGIETKLPLIPQAFQAALAFKANGNLATVSTGVEGVDSRFPVPANLSLQGPGGSFYPLTAGAEGYFNNWETPGRPDVGFYNIVGRVRVPFFRDVKVQLHVTPTGPTTAQVAVMGGWPAESGSGANRGWSTGSQDYFNTAKFDPNHDGFPGGLNANTYRNSPDENFHPRAQQNWIDVAFFDYPLTWNPVLREFKGFEPAKVVLPVIDVDSDLKQLTPGKVDFDFAQDISVQLPRLKVLDFANDALNEINSPIHSVSNAIRAALGSALDTSGLTSGFRGLQNVLRENSDTFFRPVLEPALDQVASQISAALAAEMGGGKASLLNKTAGIVSASSNGLQSAVMNLNGAAGQVTSVFGRLDRTFADVDNTLGVFIRVLEKDGSGQRHVVRTIIQKIAADQGPALGLAANLADPVLNPLLADLEPTLAQIEAELRQLRQQFSQLRTQIIGASGDFAAALNTANHTTGTLQTYLQQAGGGVSNLLLSVVGPEGDYFTADPARAKREIRERLIVTFLGSPLPGAYQTTFRQFMSDKNFLLDQLMDVLFDQVNRSIRKSLESFLAGAADGVFQNMKGSGLMSGSLLSAKIRGAPTFEGDSLRKIHLDAEMAMNLPDELKFTAYMDIKELNSATTPISCIPPGAPAAEVTLGARDIPLDWIGVTSGTPLTLSIEARWTLQSGAVLGIGGAFEVKGKMGFKGCSVNNFGASLAFGATENYFAAKAGATVLILGIPVDFDVGIFVGKACSLDPLRFIDPEVQDVLIVAATDFAGVYLQFGGGLSLSEILFGTSSCFLDVSARVSNAMYYQGGAALGSIGGRTKTTIEADLICIISASAEWAVGMRLDSAGELIIRGQARLCGKLGYCPFCLKACKSITVTGILNDGGIDYDIDF